jgi:hypothetical protein
VAAAIQAASTKKVVRDDSHRYFDVVDALSNPGVYRLNDSGVRQQIWKMVTDQPVRLFRWLHRDRFAQNDDVMAV